MSYQINKFDGTVLTVLQDGTIDVSTSLTLVGRNTTGYGEIQNENFVFLLENFANSAPPSTPIVGQLWVDSDANTVNSYDGDKWNVIGSATVSDGQPDNKPLGSFWLDSFNKNLFVYDGSEWQFVGPGNLGDFGLTRLESTQIQGEDGRTYPVILHYVNDTAIAISANDNFTINQTVNPLLGFNSISPGLTMQTGKEFRGDLFGTANRAKILDSTRSINGVGFNGSKNINILAPTPNNLVPGDYIKGLSFNGADEITWDIDASPQNNIGTVVARDSQGNFSANIIRSKVVGNLEGNVDGISGKFRSVEADQFIGQSLSGNAATATQLRFPRNINGVTFDGTQDITVPASARTLTDNTLTSTVLFSNLQRVGTLETLRIADNGVTIGNSAQLLLNNLESPNITAKNSFSINLETDNYLTFIPGTASLSLGGDNTNTIFSNDPEGVNIGHSTRKFNKIYATTLEGNATSADSSALTENIIGGGTGAIPYQTQTSVTGFVAPSTPGLYLRLNSAAEPVWDSVQTQSLLAGQYLIGNSYDGLNEQTWSVDATSTNSADKLVARDASGNFAANSITADLAGNANSADKLATARSINGVSFDGTADITITAQDPDSVTKSGDSMTGFLTLNANPTSNLHAATKQYVDSQLIGAIPLWAGTTTFSNVQATYSNFPAGTRVAFWEERTYFRSANSNGGSVRISDRYRRVVRKNSNGSWSTVG